MTRKVLRFVFLFLFKLLTRLEVSGLENIPRSGGCILAVNHLSRLDAPLIYVVVNRLDITGLAADKYKDQPFFRWIVNTVGGIWINREEADFRALRAAIDYIQKGGILGIAPEGTRSTTGGLILAKTGVAYLADRTQAPVIPAAISGTEHAVKQLFSLRKPHLHVQFGKALHFPPLNRQNRTQLLQQNTEELMCQIASLLPPTNQGVYSDHPRLKELLAGTRVELVG